MAPRLPAPGLLFITAIGGLCSVYMTQESPSAERVFIRSCRADTSAVHKYSAFIMKRYLEDPLAEWQAASKQRFDLVTDPEVHWRKLVDLAMLAHERRQVRSDELSEMLELADAARLWGLVEWEEADRVGLFLGHVIDPDDVSFFAKRDR